MKGKLLDYSIWLSCFNNAGLFADSGTLSFIVQNQNYALRKLRIKALASDTAGGFGPCTVDGRIYLSANDPLLNQPTFTLVPTAGVILGTNVISANDRADWEGYIPFSSNPQNPMIFEIGGSIDPLMAASAIVAEVTISIQIEII